tara:strand:+ start:27175 stop:27822 length:648 start_codon:yes stop_codon:yes gene_type:complete
VHEDAIIQYVATDSYNEKCHLYENYIKPAFDEMVDKIVYTYKFTTLPNIDDLKEECKVWLTTILDKYNPNKGSKAFSYFSVITKNWFIAKVKKTSKKMKREISIDDYIRKNHNSAILQTDENYTLIKEKEEFWTSLWAEINSWDSTNMRPNEKKVYEAIKTIFSNADKLEIFNKKAIYLYLREITGLNTKQIVAQLNKMRVKYKSFKNDWEEGNI